MPAVTRMAGWLGLILAAAAGTPRLLPAAEIDRVARKFASYGQTRRRRAWP